MQVPAWFRTSCYSAALKHKIWWLGAVRDFPDRIRVRREDASQNMHRFYRMVVQRDVFGGASLIREWRRIVRTGQVRIDHHPDVRSDASAIDRGSAWLAVGDSPHGRKPHRCQPCGDPEKPRRVRGARLDPGAARAGAVPHVAGGNVMGKFLTASARGFYSQTSSRRLRNLRSQTLTHY